MNNILPKPAVATDAFGFTERNRSTIQSVFKQFSSVKQVVLFGSRAAGTHRTYSDIDLCIINADFNLRQFSALITAFEESDLPYFTDLLFFYRLQNEALKAQIISSRIVIYSNTV